MMAPIELDKIVLGDQYRLVFILFMLLDTWIGMKPDQRWLQTNVKDMLHQVDQLSGRRDAKQVFLSSCQEKKTAREREGDATMVGWCGNTHRAV